MPRNSLANSRLVAVDLAPFAFFDAAYRRSSAYCPYAHLCVSSWGNWLSVYRYARHSPLRKHRHEPERGIAARQVDSCVARGLVQLLFERCWNVVLSQHLCARKDSVGVNFFSFVKEENQIICLEVGYAIPEHPEKALIHQRVDARFKLFMLRLTFHLYSPIDA